MPDHLRVVSSIARRRRKHTAHARDEKALCLLEATERLIAGGYSFAELSVEQLCREAGIGRSTYYVYFKDKGDLIRGLTQKISAEMIQGSRPWFDVASHATRDQLLQAMVDTFKIYRRHQAVFTLLAETSSYHPEVNEAFNNLLGAYNDQSIEAIRAGQASGVMRGDIDEATFLALVWMCERVAYRTVRNSTDKELIESAEVVTTIVWRMLYKDAMD